MTYLTAVADEGADNAADESLVARVIAGDTKAYETLMRRHNRRVFRAARSIVKTDDEAEDVMQDAYVSAFAHLAEFGGRARFSTWLVRIAVYEALRRLRKAKRVASINDTVLDEEPVDGRRTPEQNASDGELARVLEGAVDALPLGFRAVFVLRAVEEMSVAETAEALEIPEETVRTRMHRARAMLRDNLIETIEEAAGDSFGFHLSRCDRVVANVNARIAESMNRNQERG